MSNRLKLLREKATRPRRTVPLLLDGEVRGQIEAVEDELDHLETAPASIDRRMSTKSNDARRKELLGQVEQLREAASESTLYVVLEGISSTAYAALSAQHPRLDDEGKKVPGVDVPTLSTPLIRACLVGYRERPDADAETLPIEPEMVDWLLGHTDDEGNEVPAFITFSQLDDLAAAAFRVCLGDDAVPLPRRRSATGTSDSE